MGGATSTVKKSSSPSEDDESSPEEPSAKRVKKEDPMVSIEALGQIWELEIVLAKQSPVLKRALEEDEQQNGIGEEDLEDRNIKFVINNPDITIDGLHQIFCYLCNRPMQLNISNVEQVLSAAKYLEVENVIEDCVSVHEERFSKETILNYYEQSLTWDIPLFKTTVLDYLFANFWKLSEDLEFLRDVNRDLFKILIFDGRLLVQNAEYNVYRILKKWIMLDQLKICKLVDITPGDDFSTFISSVNPMFSSSIYFDLLKGIRFTHMLNTHSSIEELSKDKLLPEIILKDMLADMWMNQLIPNGLTPTTTTANEEEMEAIDVVDFKAFHESCMRFGHLINGEGSWNWFRIIFGVHLEFQYSDGKIYVIRKFVRGQLTDTATDVYAFIRGTLCSDDGKVFLDFDQTKINITPRKAILLCIVPEEHQDKEFMFHLMLLPISKSYIPTDKYFKKHINKLTRKMLPQHMVNGISNSRATTALNGENNNDDDEND